jgi:hypothetical protein
VLAAATYPVEWSNFFLLAGTGSATLAGLVFVALTINLRGVAKDATHRFRAINMLAGFTSAFVLSALALMGHQSNLALGIEWLAVSLFAAVVNTNGYVQAFRARSSLYALSAFRIVAGSACYAGQIVGSILLLLGNPIGIYIAAIALIVNFVVLISGSWLLILGTLQTAD